MADKNNKVSYFTNKDAIALFDRNVDTTTSKATYSKDLAKYMNENNNNAKVTSGTVNNYTPRTPATTTNQTKTEDQKEIEELKAKLNTQDSNT